MPTTMPGRRPRDTHKGVDQDVMVVHGLPQRGTDLSAESFMSYDGRERCGAKRTHGIFREGGSVWGNTVWNFAAFAWMFIGYFTRSESYSRAERDFIRALCQLESTEFSATRRGRAAPVPGAAVRG